MPGIAHDLSDESFRDLMAPLGPFETRPRICVAVSGGGDSVALASLLAGWTGALGGDLIALTVDHGLREGSASECRRVSRWMGELGVEHHTLAWAEPKPNTRVQERAREARYTLMEKWCRDNGVLHLAVAHTLEDQAETFLMRLSRGSGPDGLAGMSAVVEKPDCRILRPLLAVSRRSLRNHLQSAGKEWIEDPSNLDRRFERVRWRQAMARSELSPTALTVAAERYAGTRAVMERETAKAIARTLKLHPFGLVTGDMGRLRDLPGDLFSRVMARVFLTVGGKRFPPRRGKLDPLVDQSRERRHRRIGDFNHPRSEHFAVEYSATTLAKWRQPVASLGEAGGAAEPDGKPSVPMVNRAGYDGEILRKPAVFPMHKQTITVHRNSASAERRTRFLLGSQTIDEAGLVEVPHLGFVRKDVEPMGTAIRSLAFKPLNSLSGRGFFVAK